MAGPRTPIPAAQAARYAQERALAENLTKTELRVLIAVMAMVTGYDRLSDTVATSVLSAKLRTDPRHVQRAVKKLAELGIFEREIGTRARASRYTFPLPPKGAEPAPHSKGAEPAPDSANGGRISSEWGADSDAMGGAHAPPSEVLSEASSEEREDAGLVRPRFTTADPLAAALSLVVHKGIEGEISAAVAAIERAGNAGALVDLANRSTSAQFTYARQLEAHLSPTATTGAPPAPRRPPEARSTCGTCNGSRYVLELGTNDATKCGDCGGSGYRPAIHLAAVAGERWTGDLGPSLLGNPNDLEPSGRCR